MALLTFLPDGYSCWSTLKGVVCRNSAALAPNSLFITVMSDASASFDKK